MKKRTIFYIISTVLLTVCVLFVVLYDHVHNDRSKENIFEIPKTSNIWQSGNSIRYEKYYFIQNPPSSQKDLENMVIEYVDQNNIISDATKNGVTYVALSFMISNFKLPIYFEENKNYSKMDDHIQNYIKTNRIVIYTYDFESSESHLSIEPK